MKIRLIFLIAILTSVAQVGRCERIKDIVDIQGIRGNPLKGEGVVIGLAGTGDSTKPSRQMLVNIFRDAGQVYEADDFTGGNIAAVIVTAQLSPFAHEGALLDVEVSSVGDAKSLQGGQLLPVLLKGLDDNIYATAHGSIFTGGFAASGAKGSITKNHQLVGRIPGGAIVERSEIAHYIEEIGEGRFITLNLRNNDFATSERISKAINGIYSDSAVAIDPGTIRVKIPEQVDEEHVTGFIVKIRALEVEVDVPAVVVINERTGTIVVGANVGIAPAQAISQGSLVVKVKETAIVSQPNGMFSDAGTTQVVDETLLEVEEKRGFLIPIPKVITVSDLSRELNAIGATPRDLIAIFNALKVAGALQAQLKIM